MVVGEAVVPALVGLALVAVVVASVAEASAFVQVLNHQNRPVVAELV